MARCHKNKKQSFGMELCVLDILKLETCVSLMCWSQIELTGEDASNIPQILICKRRVEHCATVYVQGILSAWKFLVCQNRSVVGVKLTA